MVRASERLTQAVVCAVIDVNGLWDSESPLRSSSQRDSLILRVAATDEMGYDIWVFPLRSSTSRSEKSPWFPDQTIFPSFDLQRSLETLDKWLWRFKHTGVRSCLRSSSVRLNLNHFEAHARLAKEFR
jgi:hypothetical protein